MKKRLKIKLLRYCISRRRDNYTAPSNPKISKTVMPDERLSYNDFHQHINEQLKIT